MVSNASPTIVGDKVYFGVGEELIDKDGNADPRIRALVALDASKAKPGELDLIKAGGEIWKQ